MYRIAVPLHAQAIHVHMIGEFQRPVPWYPLTELFLVNLRFSEFQRNKALGIPERTIPSPARNTGRCRQ